MSKHNRIHELLALAVAAISFENYVSFWPHYMKTVGLSAFIMSLFVAMYWITHRRYFGKRNFIVVVLIYITIAIFLLINLIIHPIVYSVPPAIATAIGVWIVITELKKND